MTVDRAGTVHYGIMLSEVSEGRERASGHVEVATGKMRSVNWQHFIINKK